MKQIMLGLDRGSYGELKKVAMDREEWKNQYNNESINKL